MISSEQKTHSLTSPLSDVSLPWKELTSKHVYFGCGWELKYTVSFKIICQWNLQVVMGKETSSVCLSPFLSCWTLTFLLFYPVFFSYLKAIWSDLLIPLPSFLSQYLLAQTGGFKFCANWEGQVCICILHLTGIIANHKTNLLAVQPWILWFLILEMTQVERFKEKCIVCISASILSLCL